MPPFHSDDEDPDPDSRYDDIEAEILEGRKCLGLAFSDAASLGPYQVGVLKGLV